MIKEGTKDYNHFFGYVSHKDDPDNYTAFFDYDDVDEETMKHYKGYKTVTEQSIDWVSYLNDDELEQIKYLTIS